MFVANSVYSCSGLHPSPSLYHRRTAFVSTTVIDNVRRNYCWMAIHHDRWNEPLPSDIAVCSRCLIMSLLEYSARMSRWRYTKPMQAVSPARPSAGHTWQLEVVDARHDGRQEVVRAQTILGLLADYGQRRVQAPQPCATQRGQLGEQRPNA